MRGEVSFFHNSFPALGLVVEMPARLVEQEEWVLRVQCDRWATL